MQTIKKEKQQPVLNNKPRKLTISRKLTTRFYQANDKETPEIRLGGDWLYNLGFKPGRKVSVAQMYGELIITLEAG